MQHLESDFKFVISSLAEKDLLQSIFIIFKKFLDVAEVLDLLIVVVCSFILGFLVFKYSRADILTDCRKYRKLYANIFYFLYYLIFLGFSHLFFIITYANGFMPNLIKLIISYDHKASKNTDLL